MPDYEKFNLTEEDIKIGMEDFFTQLLIEARRSSNKRLRTLDDLSSEVPTVHYLVGQPGSGKTTLGKKVSDKYDNEGECVVEVGSDKIATYHRYYDELLKLLPDECYTLSRQFVRPVKPIILDTLRSKKISMIMEHTLSKGEKDYKTLERFKGAGYNVEINIMAVDKYESFLSCIERDITLLELGYDARPVARVNHDRMYDPFLAELVEIENRGLCDKVNVYARGEVKTQPKLVWTTGDNRFRSAQEAIISARAQERRNIMAEPQVYLERLRNAKRKIRLLIEDERMRKDYLRNISQLEREFLNELTFEKNKE